MGRRLNHQAKRIDIETHHYTKIQIDMPGVLREEDCPRVAEAILEQLKARARTLRGEKQ